jgi:hypothetical protein
VASEGGEVDYPGRGPIPQTTLAERIAAGLIAMFWS